MNKRKMRRNNVYLHEYARLMLRAHISALLVSAFIVFVGCGGSKGDSFPLNEEPVTLTYSDGIPTIPNLIGTRKESRIFFSADQEGNGNADVYSIRPDGTDLIRMTATTAAETSPTFSPSKQVVVFARSVKRGLLDDSNRTNLFDPNRASELWVMSINGENPHCIYPNDLTSPFDKARHLFVSFPRFSPEGNLVVYFRTAKKDDGTFTTFLSRTDIETGATVDLVANIARAGGPPTWSPDGLRLAFSQLKDSKYRIFIVDKDGKNLKQVTDPPISFPANGSILSTNRQVASDSSPIFTPPSYTGVPSLIFARRLEVRTDNGKSIDQSGIYQVPLSKLEEASVKPLTPEGATLLVGDAPSFAPEGDRIIYVGRSTTGAFGFSIYTIGASESTVLLVSPSTFLTQKNLLGPPQWCSGTL
ncbi:hypothetical protein [Armatimonas sp.]|uniref:TolB family protein n=1 Tax=Armatimonas sp. TaxID=1872638 RepID=UPI00286D26BF|nr:hypothetical protein [Armatimonas sp.]